MERHAAQAALEYVRDDMTIGLGSGRAVEYLVEFLSMENYRNLKVVTNNMATALMAQKKGLNVVPSWMVGELDYTFDTLDVLAKDLNGSKTDTTALIDNKILASMAKQFIVMVSKDGFVEILENGVPVEVEVSRNALGYVKHRLEDMNALVYETDHDHHEPIISASGNYILEAKFHDLKNLKELNLAIESIPGVIATSLFTDLNTTALVYDKDTVETYTGITE